MPVEKRQEALKKNYWFECLCIPCVELWPMFHEMNVNELRIPCQTDRCPFVFVVRHDDEPFITCDYCHSVTTIFPHLKGLMVSISVIYRVLRSETYKSICRFENTPSKQYLSIFKP